MLESFVNDTLPSSSHLFDDEIEKKITLFWLSAKMCRIFAPLPSSVDVLFSSAVYCSEDKGMISVTLFSVYAHHINCIDHEDVDPSDFGTVYELVALYFATASRAFRNEAIAFFFGV